MSTISIDGDRLLGRIRTLGGIGRDEAGRLTRLAATDADKLGRDAFVAWSRDAGLDVRIDRIGNLFAIWGGGQGHAPLMIGSHIDTVIDAGMFDGCYGVLAGLEVVQTLAETGVSPDRPIVVAAFTNEEGVRFSPDMMGSAVFAGSHPLEAALASEGTDGALLGAELRRIGYAGDEEPGFLKPGAYLELHIEQGPILEHEGVGIGAVDSLQGISWQRIAIVGEANHAGTTPMTMRRDAGHAAARVIDFLRRSALERAPRLVATVGSLGLWPNAINVVPGEAVLTVDMRSPDADILAAAEARFAAFLQEMRSEGGFSITQTRLVRTEPVQFDGRIVRLVETAAAGRGLTVRRMTSGAGHDAQMLAPIAPTAMIFVPSAGGISHNPREHTADDPLIAGANVLLDVVRDLIAALPSGGGA
ncbi:Zn-dependent hydrolase [Labrys wisconsinensis]|uniref:N-carbamoyl-L-amino-acid hydrolase n=1 Tax=Labrys wisconsinensis TaxID=425677 RepID=A0ABU0JKV5_9HYPH|nr:Zn-dependent hydrolase [Labrys wisconsinensis]MDQ0474091.1 N-carbamoyl-L-amino-acid hydrolase [Labrys wisconsinensis]